MLTLQQALSFPDQFYGSCLIDPQEAQRHFDLHKNIRPLKPSSVDYFVSLIQSGQWCTEHPSPISFDRNNILVDGQHRMLSIAKANVSVMATILTKLDWTKVKEHIDNGVARKLNERLTLSEDNNKRKVQVTSVVYQLLKGRSYRKVTPGDIEKTYYLYSEGIDYVSSVLPGERKGLTRAGTLAALVFCYHYTDGQNTRIAKSFIESVLLEDGESQPGRKMRNWILLYCPTGGGLPTSINISERIYYAFSYHLAGQTISQIHRFSEIRDIRKKK